MSECQDEAIGLLAGLLRAHYAAALEKAGWTPGWEDDAERILAALEVPARSADGRRMSGPQKDTWTMLRRRDWPHTGLNPWLQPPGAPVVSSDDELEVFEVVPASRLQEATEALRAVDAHYSGSLDFQPTYVRMARAALDSLGEVSGE